MSVFIRNSLCVVGAILLSEIAYKIYLKLRCIKTRKEFNQIIFTNELSFKCVDHTLNSLCKNDNCYLRNIERLVKIIDSAKKSIHLSMYIFTCSEISDAIVRAKNRGLSVRIIMEHTLAYSSGSQIHQLKKNDIPILMPNSSDMLMHHKFCLIDVPEQETQLDKVNVKNVTSENGVHCGEMCNRSKNVNLVNNNCDILGIPPTGLLMTGSLNWTMKGLSANWENLLITTNSTLIEPYKMEFQRIWITFK